MMQVALALPYQHLAWPASVICDELIRWLIDAVGRGMTDATTLYLLGLATSAIDRWRRRARR